MGPMVPDTPRSVRQNCVRQKGTPWPLFPPASQAMPRNRLKYYMHMSKGALIHIKPFLCFGLVDCLFYATRLGFLPLDRDAACRGLPLLPR